MAQETFRRHFVCEAPAGFFAADTSGQRGSWRVTLRFKSRALAALKLVAFCGLYKKNGGLIKSSLQ